MKKILLPTTLFIIAIGLFYVHKINEQSNSNEKKRTWNQAAKFWHELKADPLTNEIDYNKVKEARNKSMVLGLKRTGNLNWVDKGPTNFGGRTRAILFDRTTSDGSKVYAGSATGGIFVSYNEGGLWSAVPGLPSLPISAMAQHPDGNIYIGTGSVHEGGIFGNGASSKRGSGMYRFNPNDESATFEFIPSTQPGASWGNINSIEIDQNSGRIYAATFGGLMYSDDKADTWTNAVSGTQFHDIAVADDGAVLTCERYEIFKSSTGNAGSFSPIYPSNFSTSGVGSVFRFELAFAPSNSDFAYVLAINSDGEFGALYQSKDRGISWDRKLPGNNFHPFISREGQGLYDAFLAVDPLNPEKILIGGVELWEWDGGFTQIVSEDPVPVGGKYSGYYMHADKHCFAYSHAHPELLLVGNDGGISKSLDGAKTFYPANRGYNVAQFYSIATDRYGKLIGGTQDNGTIIVDGSNPNFPLEGESIDGGDGFRCAMSSISDMAFTTVYEGQISRGYVGNPMGSICQKWQCQDNNFYTSIALWESLEDSTSKDFITFKAEDGSNKYTLLSTNGIAKNFSGQVNLPQTTSNIVIGSIRFQAGNQVLYDLGNGQLGGDGSGYFDYSADNYNLSFNSPPTNGTELKAYFELYYNAGDQIILKSNTNGVYKLNQPFEIKHTLVSNLNPGDSILIKDPVQSMLGYGASDDTLWVLRGAINLNKPAEWFPIPLEKQFIMEDFNSLNFDNWPNINGNISSSCGLNSNALLFDGVSRSIESSYLNLTGQTKLGLDVFNNLNCSPATANDTLFIEFLNNNSNNNWVVMSEMILGGQDERISLKLPSAAASSNTKIRIRQGSSSYIPGSNVCAIDNILFTKKITIGRIKSMQFSSDGNHLFVGSMSGKVLRVSGLNEVYSELDAEPINNKVKCSAIFSAGSRVVTGIGINPNDDDQLIFTLGNYGSYTDYVYYTSILSSFQGSCSGSVHA